MVWQADSTPTCGFVFASCMHKQQKKTPSWVRAEDVQDVKDVENVENVQYVEDDVHNSETNTSPGNSNASVSEETEGMIVKTEL